MALLEDPRNTDYVIRRNLLPMLPGNGSTGGRITLNLFDDPIARRVIAEYARHVREKNPDLAWELSELLICVFEGLQEAETKTGAS